MPGVWRPRTKNRLVGQTHTTVARWVGQLLSLEKSKARLLVLGQVAKNISTVSDKQLL